MRSIQLAILTVAVCSAHAFAQQARPEGEPPRDRGDKPAVPTQALTDCKGKQAGDTVLHTTPEGQVNATCEQTPNGLMARPTARAQKNDNKTKGKKDGEKSSRYNLEQAMSDKAQLHTIAFDALAFLTGDFAYDTFLPPGKVSDYFGFQYMRDIDSAEGGHSTSFLTRIANYTLSALSDAQRAQLIALAKAQQADIRRFAEMRLPLMAAFRRNLEGKFPAGSRGLNRAAVVQQSALLYELDGKLAYERAKVMADVVRQFTPAQKEALARARFGDSRSWPDAAAPLDKRSLTHDEDVAVMTYASEMFSWYAGSLDADTYFCPERHGMYFGGFGMKTAPAMGKQNYSISTTLTGDSGEALLQILGPSQSRPITDLIAQQKPALQEIADVRRSIATELRRLLKGESADLQRVLSLSRRYGELDGDLSYLYAVAFGKVGQSLSANQKAGLQAMRKVDPSEPKGPFIYSNPVRDLRLANTDAYFAP